ncbi:hypothetical protein L873DRAFT_444422 [Choiromyces venosus 120613-1]|uniref:Secreted protein n=1 Tax=Choiromyces venosus 120613-1 TaxID=1336337 RepID=A0A3N4IX04_9PEZI|nr:hypothetical protein L873DRAFT_444422 [Choiromyces venosus 120613-1]
MFESVRLKALSVFLSLSLPLSPSLSHHYRLQPLQKKILEIDTGSRVLFPSSSSFSPSFVVRRRSCCTLVMVQRYRQYDTVRLS